MPTTELIASEPLVRFLLDHCAMLEPYWPGIRRPCGEENRREITRWGDTLRFSFWARYVIHIPESLDVCEFGAALMSVGQGLFIYVEPVMNVDLKMRGIPGEEASGQ
jgi:hypothetical protein